jgi:hypothetical protein
MRRRSAAAIRPEKCCRLRERTQRQLSGDFDR